MAAPTAGAPSTSLSALSSPSAIVDRVRLVTDEFREFSVEPAEARAAYGVSPQLLGELLDLGLPARLVDQVPWLDARDLANIALHLGLPSMQRRAIVGWRQTLFSAARGERARYRLSYCAACPTPGHSGPCDISLTLPAAAGPGAEAAKDTSTESGTGAATTAVELATRWPDLPAEAQSVADAVADLQFFALPPALREDLTFGRQTRLAGCRMAARLVAAECQAAGLTAVTRSGLLLSVPFSTPHSWVELAVADRWVPFDPHLIHMMIRHAGLDEAQWPVVRSPGAVLAAFAPGPVEPGYHNGEPIEVSITTHLESP